MRCRRTFTVVAFMFVLLVLAAAPAVAGDILEPADAAELAQLLADAADEQDICYGWRMTVQDRQNGGLLFDVGSSTGGPDARLVSSLCREYAEVVVDATYTGDFEEAEDSASYHVESSFLPPSTTLDVSGDDLVGDNDDVALFNAAAQLPALAAENGAAPWVKPYPNSSEIPSTDRLTGSPAGDWIRTNWALTVLLVLGALASLGWLLYELFGRNLLDKYSSL